LRSEIISSEMNFTKIKVEIEVSDFLKKIDEAAEILRAKANIKGFRKGRVPRKVLELHLGADAIRAEALEKLVPETVDSIINEYELDIISEPKVEILTFEQDKPVEMTILFETRPEVESPELESIEVPVKKVKISEKILEDAINVLKDNNAEKKPVDDRASRENDVLEVEYSVSVAEEKRAPDGPAGLQKGFLELGSDSVRPELSKALEGRRTGDSVTVAVPVQVGESSEEKNIIYNINVISVSEKILPEMSSDFFEKVTGEPDLSEEDFRRRIGVKLQENFDLESKKEAEKHAVELLVERSKVVIPESLVQKQKAAIIREMEDRIQKQTGKTLEKYCEENGLERARFEEGSASEATGVVKRSLVLEALADREMIQVDNTDIDKEINNMAISFNVPVSQMQQFFLKNSDGIADLVHRVRMKKTLDLLMEKVTLKEDGPEEPDSN